MVSLFRFRRGELFDVWSEQEMEFNFVSERLRTPIRSSLAEEMMDAVLFNTVYAKVTLWKQSQRDIAHHQNRYDRTTGEISRSVSLASCARDKSSLFAAGLVQAAEAKEGAVTPGLPRDSKFSMTSRKATPWRPYVWNSGQNPPTFVAAIEAFFL